MNIIINGKKAVLKKNVSFDLISENRLFLGRDSYTLAIAFPLKGCQANIDIFGYINRFDVSKDNVHFECAITDGEIALVGILSVVKVSETEVECQFSEGRCAQTVTDPNKEIYISELDLGKSLITDPSEVTPAQAWRSIDDGANEVALPWVNEKYPEAANNWVVPSYSSYSWDTSIDKLSWQPYLIVIAKRICESIGYSYDFSEWEASPLRFLIICNTFPGSWDMPEYANVLPKWTVSEFFEKLELFMMCEFDFDHRNKAVTMRFSKNVIQSIEPVKIDSVVDAFDMEVSQDDLSSCNYIAAKRLAYKESSAEIFKYYSCDWFVKNNTVVKRYDTLKELIEANKRKDAYSNNQLSRVYWGEAMGAPWGSRVTTLRALMYATDVDTYFVFRSIGTEQISENRYTQVYVLQPVNIFGSGKVDNDNTEEIEFVPVPIADTYIDKNDDKGYMMFLTPPDFSEDVSSEGGKRPSAGTAEDSRSEINQPAPAKAIESGEKDTSSNRYDEIYVGFWNNTVPEPGKTPYPIIDGLIVSQNWNYREIPGFSMRLYGCYGGNVSLLDELPKINPLQKFKFSWIGKTIPNPRAIFYIRGRQYVCDKITATFTENGISQLLKGEFYPLIDQN